jgi:uncharacterized damage-inducible protein DinB
MENVNPRVYPIGKHIRPEAVTPEMRKQYIARLENMPANLRTLAAQLTEKHLASSYRENGWTARQIIHHLADSHCNMYLRIKLAITSDNPTINPYDENKWAEFPDGKSGDINVSLNLVEALHTRLVSTLHSLQNEDFNCTYVHPQYETTSTIDQVLALYAWHGDHHVGQLEVILNDF